MIKFPITPIPTALHKKELFCLCLFLIFAAAANGLNAQAESIDVNKLYLGARFSEIIIYFETKEKQKNWEFPLKEKLLYIESLAREAKVRKAEALLNPLLADNPSDPAVLSAAGMVYLAMGKLDRAKKYIDSALRIEPGFKKAILTGVTLLLYYREYNEAGKRYEKLLTMAVNEEWADSDLLFLVGLDVYRACRDSQRLQELYKTHAGKMKKINLQRYENLKANYRMYKRKNTEKEILFHIETVSDKIAVPFTSEENVLRMNTISMTAKGKTFKVLLDTGNAAGWILHSGELKDYLKVKKGGRSLTRIGAGAGLLDGYRHYCKVVHFNGFKIHHLEGVYVPKPHPNFPDANLNPVFINNRIVTIDFVKKELVLRTKARFEKDVVQGGNEKRLARLPWYGYKYAFVPFKIDKTQKTGLALIETGAEDIALKFDFVDGLGLSLKPRVKYLANGKEFRYHLAEVTLLAGGFRFQRKAAEVWPFGGFRNRVTGLTADAVIGPAALKGKFSVSFDPFARQVILEQAD